MSHSATTPAPATAVFRLPRRPKAVVFDLDGTLIDSETLVLEAYMAAAQRHDQALDQRAQSLRNAGTKAV